MVTPTNTGKAVNTPAQPEINRDQAIQAINQRLEVLDSESKKLRGMLRELGVKTSTAPRKPMSAETKAKLSKGLSAWREKNQARKTAEIAALIKETIPVAQALAKNPSK